MTEQEFTKNWTCVEAWVNSMRPHWRYLNGDVFNDKDFWQQCIHSVPAGTWTAWCEIYGDLREGAPGAFARHTHIYEDSVVLNTRIDQGQAISKPYNKTGYNKPVFRAAMAIKDIVADITDRPFLTKQAEIATKRVKPTQEEVLAHFAKSHEMLKELFVTGL